MGLVIHDAKEHVPHAEMYLPCHAINKTHLFGRSFSKRQKKKADKMSKQVDI